MEIHMIVEAEKILSNCSPEHEFVLSGGNHLKNLEELAIAIQSMSQDEYNSHANPSKNDFANWIMHVFSLTKEADTLRSIETKEGSVKYLLEIIEKAHNTHERENELREKIEELKLKVPKPPSQEIQKEIFAEIPEPPKSEVFEEKITLIEEKREVIPERKEELPKEKEEIKITKQEMEKTLDELRKDIKKTINEDMNMLKKPEAVPNPAPEKQKLSLRQIVSNPVLWIGLLTGFTLGIIITALSYSLLD